MGFAVMIGGSLSEVAAMDCTDLSGLTIRALNGAPAEHMALSTDPAHRHATAGSAFAFIRMHSWMSRSGGESANGRE